MLSADVLRYFYFRSQFVLQDKTQKSTVLLVKLQALSGKMSFSSLAVHSRP